MNFQALIPFYYFNLLEISPYSDLDNALRLLFFLNCHSSREPHLKLWNSISVVSFEEDLFESDLAF